MSDKISTVELAERAFDKQCELGCLTQYPGLVSLEAMARLWLWSKDERFLKKFRDYIKPYVELEITKSMGAFRLYNIGGGPSALMLRYGFLKEAETLVFDRANELLQNCPRSKEGIFSSQFWKKNDPPRIWIDVAFAVSPFLVNAGLHFNKPEWVNEGVEQTVKMLNIFRDETGLCHQSRGFCGEWQQEADPMQLSDDHWSRGNGWGILTLAELCLDLPATHSKAPLINDMLGQFAVACLNFQDEEGMWHQEITDHKSYVETSGSGKILYAIGVALEKNIIDKKYRENFIKGLKGYLAYIGQDYSIHNVCTGVISPGMGTKAEYSAHPFKMNDHHGFGPVILAFGQAAKLGISDI